MVFAVADTHAAVWYLTGDARLSPAAKAIIDEAASTRNKIAISSISLAEVIYLVDKGRVDEMAYDDLKRALLDPGTCLRRIHLQCGHCRSDEAGASCLSAGHARPHDHRDRRTSRRAGSQSG